MNQSTSKSNVISQIMLSAVAGALGYLLLFNKNVQVITLCQVFCGGLVAVGIISIVSYFLSGDYKRIDRYGFAYGVLLIILGFIGLLRITDLTGNFELYTGMLSLILGVLILQGAVQVKVLHYPVWVLNLILAVVSICGAFCVLSRIQAVTDRVAGFSSWVLLITGASCLIGMLIVGICILLAGRREKKEQKEAENQPAPVPAPAPGPEVVPGSYQPAEEPAPAPAPSAAFTPAESHHGGESADESVQSELPPLENPQLTFEPSENHHSDFTP